MVQLIPVWVWTASCVGIAVLGNSVSAVWAKGKFFSYWLLALVAISILVFVSFGVVSSRIGLAIGSGTVDSLITITSTTVGLVFFGEWKKLSVLQYLGMLLALTGVFFMLFLTK